MLAIYTRLSREDDKSTSIYNQKREGKKFAETKKFASYHIYNEGEGVSGTVELDNRPQLFELISHIKNGEVTAVWMRNQNRLDRNTATFYLFVTAVKKANIPVYFADGDAIDYNDPTTLLQSSIISSLNQYTAQLQSVQTKKALRDSASEGKAWGVLPYGYMTDQNKYIKINERQAKVIKQIFDLSLKGWGVRRIATHLSKEGVPTRYNGYEGELKTLNKYDNRVTKKDYKDIVWSPKTVLDILKNKWYIGTRTYSGVEYPTPPIIDKLLFDKVQKNLVKNKNNSGKKVEYRYLLKGILKCSKCKRNYYGRTRSNKKDNFYMCSSKRYPTLNCGNKSINIPYLESFVIKHLFKSKDLIKHLQILDKNDNSINELKDEKKKIESNLAKEYKTAERLATLLINDGLSNDQLFIDKYNISKTNISTYKARLQIIDNSIKERASNANVMTYKSNIQSIDLTNFTQLKEAIHNIIENIEILSDVNGENNDFYVIRIKYKGYNEVSMFSTTQPYNKWAHLSHRYTSKQFIQDDIDAQFFLYGKDTRPNDSEITDPQRKKEFYPESALSNIVIEKNDLIHFN